MSLERMRRKDNDDFRTVTETPQGARVIAGIMEFCGLYSQYPNGNLPFHEGMRNVGLMLLRRAADMPLGEERLLAERRERNRLLGETEEGDADEL
jgi:hypothetical protein